MLGLWVRSCWLINATAYEFNVENLVSIARSLLNFILRASSQKFLDLMHLVCCSRFCLAFDFKYLMFSLKLQLLISDVLPWNIVRGHPCITVSFLSMVSHVSKVYVHVCEPVHISVISSCHWTVILSIFPSVIFLFFGKLQASVYQKQEDGQPSL